MTTSEPDQRRGLLPPDAALTIAAALLTGATAQNFDALLRLLTQPEPKHAAQQSPAMNQDQYPELGEGPEYVEGEPVGPIQYFPLPGRVDPPWYSSCHRADETSPLLRSGCASPPCGPRN